MDPITTLSLSCNVLDLFDRAIQCGSKIKQLYDSSTGHTEDQKNLQDVTNTIATIAQELQSAQFQIAESPSDQRMQEVAKNCSFVCDAIRSVLDKCKAKKEKSIISASSAALRALLHKSDIECLQSELEKGMIMLNSLVTARTLGDVGRIKSELRSAGMEQSIILQKLESVDDHMKCIGDTQPVLQQLKELLDMMKEALGAMKATAILRSLHFASLNERFRSVHDSAPLTFEWIFGDTVLSNRPPFNEPDLMITFTDWLRSGSGIFHIAGKPGSGKSTLMKYLCEHDETERLLQEWAGQRELIFSRFFFWSVGSTEEKNLRGLVRALLYGVIQQEPAMAQLLFPKYWDEAIQRNLKFPPTIELTGREISNAFESLTRNSDILRRARICFFIDGLDEFAEGSNETHWGLAQKIHQWTAKSSGNVKFCVSSRELPSFSKVFAANQRLTLQWFTAGDIKMLVEQRLGDNENFRDLAQTHEIECEQLMRRIIGEAEGVFLWVALLLTQLEEALVNDDSMVMLENIVNSAPKELEEFLQSILDSIPRRYRESADYLLAMAMRMTGILIRDEVGVLSDLGHSIFGLVDSDSTEFLTLLGCTFVFEASDSGSLLQLTAKVTEPTDDGGQDARFQRTTTQLAARCRGLLQCSRQNVMFTHRSIPEFLQRAFAQNSTRHVLDDVLVSELLLWTHLNEVRYAMTMDLSNNDIQHLYGKRLAHILSCVCLTRLKTPETACSLLYSMEELLLEHLFDAKAPPYLECDFGLMFDLEAEHMKENVALLTVSAVTGFEEYLFWQLENTPWLKSRGYYLLNVLASIVAVGRGRGLIARHAMLDAIFRAGISVHSLYPIRSINMKPKMHGVPLWHHFLVSFVFKDPRDDIVPERLPETESFYLGELSHHIWPSIEMWLKFGADPHIFLRLNPITNRITVTGGDRRIYEAIISDAFEPSATFFRKLFKEASRWEISLKDFLLFRSPLNANEISRLIARNITSKEEVSNSEQRADLAIAERVFRV